MARQRISRTREEILEGVEVVNGAVWVVCDNCGGTGDYPSSMIPAGRCRLYCWQDRTPKTFGKFLIPVAKFVAREQRRDRADAKRERERVAFEAREREMAAVRAARSAQPDPRIAEAMRVFGFDLKIETLEVSDRDLATAWDIARKWVRDGSLSDAQFDLLAKLVARRRERIAQDAAREPVPSGRLTIEGVVVKVDEKTNDFGTREVMTVRDARGFLVWGTIPGELLRAVRDEIDPRSGDYAGMYALVRKTVRFTATVEPSDRDEFFGFFKRPAKAEILGGVAA